VNCSCNSAISADGGSFLLDRFRFAVAAKLRQDRGLGFQPTSELAYLLANTAGRAWASAR
jgi:hypothetical protein